jgi:DNA helicase-2/ATP-dependent DNA helicase PcrA
LLGRNGDDGVSKKDQVIADDLSKYISEYQRDKALIPRRQKKLLSECIEIAEACNGIVFSGDVELDWASALRIFSDKQVSALCTLAHDARFIKLLHKGSTLNSNLGQMWKSSGHYGGASMVVKNALTQEHFAMSAKTWSGINVMTIHKAKGKEFDEVIIYEGSRFGKIIHDDDLEASRLKLRVAVTRAKRQVQIFTPKDEPCILL